MTHRRLSTIKPALVCGAIILAPTCHALDLVISKQLSYLADSGQVAPSAGSSQTATPGGATSLDLVQAFDLARGRDATLASAEAAHRAGVEVLPAAKAALGPSVSATASAGMLNARVTGSPTESGTSEAGSLSATLPIYHRGDWIAVDAAKARLPGVEAQYVQAQQDLIVRVAQAYLAALLAQDTLESTHKQQEAVNAQLAQARRMQSLGAGTVTDVADAQARVDLMTATELQARNGLLIAMQILEGLTGIRGLDHLAPVAGFTHAVPSSAGGMEDWANHAVQQNPGVLEAEANAQAQRLEVDRARAAWWPTLDLTASLINQHFSQTGLDITGQGGRSAELGVSLNWQIWEAGLRDSNLRLAQAQLDQANASLLLSRGQASLQARQAYTGLQTTVAQVAAYEQAVRSSQISLDASTHGAQVGTRTTVDVLNASQQLFLARNQLATSRYAALLGWLQLKAVTAELTPDDLAVISGRR